MLHMAPSYLSAGYQELRNLRGTGEVALRQGVIASTNQTIYGMFTEQLGINMLQEKGCLVLDAGLAAARRAVSLGEQFVPYSSYAPGCGCQ